MTQTQHASSPPVADSFQVLSLFATEIRLLIWGRTWPAPRMIEAALFDNPDMDVEMEEIIEPPEIVNLRLAGSLSLMLIQDLNSRIPEYNAVESCPVPIALQVCRESREHTLSEYRMVKSLAGPFYTSPHRDLFFLSNDVADDYQINLSVLQRYHMAELNTIKKILVLDTEWPDSPLVLPGTNFGMDYTMHWISHFPSLKAVQVLWTGSGVDSYGQDETPQALGIRLRRDFLAIIEHEK